MDIYQQLAKFPVFSIIEVENLTGDVKTAYSMLGRYMKKGLVKKIRNNLYSVINPVTGQIVASRYQIACAITDSACISHHSAFEYYGYANQVFNEVYVSSNTKFNTFTYDHVSYKFIKSRMHEGIVEAKNTTEIRITDIERTVIESIRDYTKISGLEELLKSIEGINYLNEVKLLRYLELNNIQGLYQRTGYLLQHFQNELQISDNFIEHCRSKVGNSRRYLLRGSIKGNTYDNVWKLMVPVGFFEMTDQGGDILV